MKLCMKMYKKLCIKMKLCIVNKNVNGQWNLLPVNDININLQQNNKIALGRDIKKKMFGVTQALIFEIVGP